METVPVLKVTHYYGTAKRDDVYTYMRAFAYNGSMFCSVTSFDENPPQDVRVSFCFKPLDIENSLVCTCDKYTGVCTKSGKDGDITTHIKQGQVVTGNDEQGYYWGVSFEIRPKVFEIAFGKTPQDGTVYAGNLFIHSNKESAFGAAFDVPSGEKALTFKGADNFFVVPY